MKPGLMSQSTQLTISSLVLWWGAAFQYRLQINHTASPLTHTVFDNNLSFITIADRWRGNLWLIQPACSPFKAQTFNAATGWLRLYEQTDITSRCSETLVNSPTSDLVQKHFNDYLWFINATFTQWNFLCAAWFKGNRLASNKGVFLVEWSKLTMLSCNFWVTEKRQHMSRQSKLRVNKRSNMMRVWTQNRVSEQTPYYLAGRASFGG